MDKSEATNIVMSRIQALDPENASKIMGYILIQDLGEKEMIRLAFSPDSLLLYQARAALASSPPPLSYPHFHHNSPRIVIPNTNAFNFPSPTPTSPFHRTRPLPISNASQIYDDFDSIISPSGRTDSLVNSPHPFHRRSCSVNDAAFLANLEEGGAANAMWRPCMYFARGFCKNGDTCKFLHADNAAAEAADVGSPSAEMMKMKAFQHQRFAAMASGSHNLFAYNKCMDDNLRGGDLSPMGMGSAASSSARQIYLTFPADSTFKEDDVTNYFSMFGPVQDVRIPYQQKRMFGFVTFQHPETVKLILAKGNPHFVCDSRVLVKPYKEKGKVREKKHQQQQLERGEYSSCLSPSAIDSREHFDHPFGPRMMFSPQEMIMRKKLEHEAELQHAIELEGQRMRGLQLRDIKAQNQSNHYMQMFPSGIPYSSPRTSQFLMNQHVNASSHAINEDDPEECNGALDAVAAADEKFVFEEAGSSFNNNDSDLHQSFLHEISMEHVLPDNLFASPTKSTSENQASGVGDGGMPASSSDTTLLPGGSPLTMASLKSCYLQMPRYNSGQEPIEM